MESASFLVLLGGLVVVAFVAEEVFRRQRVPPVLVLMACGVLLGPVARLLPVNEFTRVAPHFGALAFLLILFEGGLDLDVKAVLDHLTPGLRLALVGFAVAFAVGTAIGALAGMPWGSALVLGIILAPISGAIVLPLVGGLEMRSEVRTVVVLEAALADVLAVLAMEFVATLRTGGGFAGLLALGSLLAAALSVAVALAAGLLWPRTVRSLSDRRFIHVLTFGVVLLLSGFFEMIGASGALVVLVFGLTLANEREILLFLHLDPTPLNRLLDDLSLRLHRFIAQLTFLVRAFFFVFLGVVVRLDTLSPRLLAEGLGVVALFVASRWLVLRFLEARGGLTLEEDERRNLLFLQPRGLVSAVLAVEATHLGIAGADSFLPVASLVIVASNLLMAVGLRPRRASE